MQSTNATQIQLVELNIDQNDQGVCFFNMLTGNRLALKELLFGACRWIDMDFGDMHVGIRVLARIHIKLLMNFWLTGNLQ